MLFPTASFAVFFIAVFIGGWVLFPGKTPWRVFMLAASYLFCGLFDFGFIWLFAVATLAGWGLLQAISAFGPRSTGAKYAMAASVALHIVVLFWFKLYGFFASSVQSVLGSLGVDPGWNIVHVIIPVGISYLIFRGISAAVDVYRGDAETPDLLDYALFMVFFPYVAAGPVVRLKQVVPQWLAKRDPAHLMAAQGLLLIAGGLVKKMLIADYLSRVVVDDVFATPGMFGSADVLLGIYGYAAQIYCDFSGYTDMAIGIAMLLGITLPQNFASPYAATTLQNFWRKWHITLSDFLRDYLYIGLGGNRKGAKRTYVNLILTMVLGGLWHGAGATFIVWGALHGVGLAAERYFSRVRRERRSRPVPAVVGWFLTVQFVCLAWIFFRADSLATAFRVIAQAFSAWDKAPILPVAAWGFIFVVLVAQFVPVSWRTSMRDRFASLNPIVQGLALAVVLFIVSALGPEGPTAFIYAGF